MIMCVCTRVCTVLGGPLPIYPGVPQFQAPFGYSGSGGGGGGGGGPAIVISAFPAAGGLTAISGMVSNLPTGAFKAVLCTYSIENGIDRYCYSILLIQSLFARANICTCVR